MWKLLKRIHRWLKSEDVLQIVTEERTNCCNDHYQVVPKTGRYLCDNCKRFCNVHKQKVLYTDDNLYNVNDKQ